MQIIEAYSTIQVFPALCCMPILISILPEASASPSEDSTKGCGSIITETDHNRVPVDQPGTAYLGDFLGLVLGLYFGQQP